MAEQRKKSHSVLLVVNGKQASLELYPAGLWPEQAWVEGAYRLRIDGKWHCAPDKYTFLTARRVGEHIALLLEGGDLPAPPPRPEGLFEARLLHVSGFTSGGDIVEGPGWALCPPHLGADGNWRIWCCVPDVARRVLALCDDVTIVRR